MSKGDGKTKSKKAKAADNLPPEDSIPLRIVVLIMAIVCVGVACFFVQTPILTTLCYLWFCIMGSYLSYVYRVERNRYIAASVQIGIIVVLYFFGKELVNSLNTGSLNILGPIIHQLAGTFVLHTFELRTRKDINISSAIGLALICLTAIVGKSLPFGFCVIVYVALGMVMLYYDCLSKSLQSWIVKPPIGRVPVLNVAPTGGQHRRSRGSVVLLLALCPFVSLMLFASIPRGTGLVDRIQSLIKGLLAGNQTIPKPDKENPDRFTAPIMSQKSKDGQHKRPDNEANSLVEDRPLNAKLQNQPKKSTAKPAAKKNGEAKMVQAAMSELEELRLRMDKIQHQIDSAADQQRTLSKQRLEALQKQLDAAKKKLDQLIRQERSWEQKGINSKDVREKIQELVESQKESRQQVKEMQEQLAQAENARAAEERRPEPLNEQKALEEPDPNRVLLKIVSNRTIYIRQAAFNEFDGQTWTKSKPSKSIEKGNPQKQESSEKGFNKGSLVQPGLPASANGMEEKNVDPLAQYFFRKPDKGPFDLTKAAALKLPKGFPSITLDQAYTVESDLNSILPVGWIPQKVDMNIDGLRVDCFGAIQAGKRIARGTTYKVTSQYPIYDIGSMRKAPATDAQLADRLRAENTMYLKLPDTHSDKVTELAAQTTSQDINWFSKAESITRLLRTTCTYVKDSNAAIEGEDNATNAFVLQTRQGNDQDYASAFVVMARCVGIPSRLVRGFSPGELNVISGCREVRATDAHTWAEVLIPDYGWVPFDPVPDGALPAPPEEFAYNFDHLMDKMPVKDPRQLKLNLIDFCMTVAKVVVFVILTLFSLRELKRAYDKWLLKRSGANPATRMFHKVQRQLKKTIKVERLAADTPADFGQRVRNACENLRSSGNSVDMQLPDTVNEFLEIYAACYFGNKDEHRALEELSERIMQLSGSTSVKKSGGRMKGR